MPEHVQSPAELAAAIQRIADVSDASEMELQIEVEKLLDTFLSNLPSRNRFGHATKLGGIKDALHGNLIIEYKRPGKLATRPGLDENISQLQRYLLEESAHYGHAATHALRKMVGVGLDGQRILFVRYRGRESAIAATRKLRPQLTIFPEAQPGDFTVDGPFPVTPESIDRFLGYLQSLARFPLTPEALAETFGPKSAVAPTRASSSPSSSL